MAAVTAIELGDDSCVLVHALVRRGQIEVQAVETIDPAAFPGGGGFETSLEQIRRQCKMPRRARVVVWGLPDGATPRGAHAAPLLEALRKAGFRIERVVSPCNALSALARSQPDRQGSTAWLAIERSHVAIVVVRPGALVYSNAFQWDSSVGATGSQARLLQRYSNVAHLAPELQRAMAAAQEQGAPIVSAFICGNVRELRSLVMPLVEELDIEVEAFDSLNGLTVAPGLTDRLMDIAPAVRLACAGAITRPARPRHSSRRRLLPLVSVAAGLALAAGGWWLLRSPHAAVAPPQASAAVPAPARNVPSPPAAAPRSAPTAPARGAVSQASPRGAAARAPEPISPAAFARLTGADEAPRPDEPARVPLPDPLPDPVPRVSTILVSANRRFALIDGRVIGVGDKLGRRVVTAIDPKTVVLREPSGLFVRVGLGGRIVGMDPPKRPI